MTNRCLIALLLAGCAAEGVRSPDARPMAPERGAAGQVEVPSGSGGQAAPDALPAILGTGGQVGDAWIASGPETQPDAVVVSGSGGAIGTRLDGGKGGAVSFGGSTGGQGPQRVVTFSDGKASGAMNGDGWIELGAYNSAANPTCQDRAGASPRPVTHAAPCSTCGGKTVWDPSHTDALCLSGSVPKVTKGDAGTDDYDNNWGLRIGVGMGPVDGCADAGATRQLYTLGQSFDKIAFTVNTASSVAPSGAVVRGELHRAGDPADVTYCAAIIGSPAVILLTSFNTKCWCDPTTTFLKSSDVPNIDWIGVRIMADNVSSYEVSGFCVSKIEFSN